MSVKVAQLKGHTVYGPFIFSARIFILSADGPWNSFTEHTPAYNPASRAQCIMRLGPRHVIDHMMIS